MIKTKLDGKQPMFMYSMAIFLGLMGVQTVIFETVQMAIWVKAVLALVPMLPLVWAFFIYRRHYKRLDEYMQQKTGEAFLWVLGALCFASYGYGMLMYKIDVPAINPAFILPVVFGIHGVVIELLVKADSDEE